MQANLFNSLICRVCRLLSNVFTVFRNVFIYLIYKRKSILSGNQFLFIPSTVAMSALSFFLIFMCLFNISITISNDSYRLQNDDYLLCVSRVKIVVRV